MDGHPEISTEVWVHPCVDVHASPIQGSGLFATSPIAADVVVVRLGGCVVTTAELHRLFDEAADGIYIDTFAIGDDTHVVLPHDTVAHYGNHSCDPTIWPTSAFELATRRRVDVGDELTVDYGLISDDATFQMDCTCSAATCRQVITGEDWRHHYLQARYAGHWPLGLQRRIDKSRQDAE